MKLEQIIKAMIGDIKDDIEKQQITNTHANYLAISRLLSVNCIDHCPLSGYCKNPEHYGWDGAEMALKATIAMFEDRLDNIC